MPVQSIPADSAAVPPPMRRALIIIDCQRDFCEGGSLPVTGGEAVASGIADLIADRRSHYDLLVATRDWHVDPANHFSDHPDYVDTWPRHCVAGTPGAEFSPSLDARGPFTQCLGAIVSKGRHAAAYSGFEGVADDGRTLNDLLTEASISTVDIVGLATDYCVTATALDARKNGFDTNLLQALTAGVSADTTAAAMADMEQAGVRIHRTA